MKKSFIYYPSQLHKVVEKIDAAIGPVVLDFLSVPEDDYEITRSSLEKAIFDAGDEAGISAAIDALMSGEKLGVFEFDESYPHPDILKSRCEQDFPRFIGRAIVHALINDGPPARAFRQEYSAGRSPAARSTRGR